MIRGCGVNRCGRNEIRYISNIDFSYKGILKPQFFGITYFGALNQKDIIISTQVSSFNINRVFIELRRKEGGLKKIWWYSQDSNNPIEGATFELTQKGSGGCQVKFAYLDIPIEAQDYVNIIVSGNHLYKGFIENDVDISFPVLTAKGYNQRLNEVLYSGDYPFATSIIDIIEDIIIDSSSKTGITFRADLIDLGVTDPIITEYIDETSGKIIDDLIARSNNRFWGVNTNNEFYIQAYNTGSIDKVFYNYDSAIHEKADFKKDYSKIKATENVVYRKDSGGSGMTREGLVGDVGNVTYPELPIIYKLREIRSKVTASELVTSQTALQWAYLKLQNDVDLKTQISVKGVNTEVYQPEINDRILVEDDFKTAFITINNTQSIAGWSNSVLQAGGLDNENCIRIFFNPAAVSVLDIGSEKQYFKQEKVGFYLKGTLGKVVTVSFSNDLVTFTDFKINLRSDEYEYYNFDFEGSFRYIQFTNDDLTSYNCCIYKVNVLCYDKRQYMEAIVNCKYTFDPIRITCDLQAGANDEAESDKLFAVEKKIRILETINAV